ncbi:MULTISPECIES: DUF2691 family protein [unclassified Clostridium]|uniref:DUF2691 family protein n=1 Tax=unclassified Clostridium TaxID=2614128 RepID=UPI001EEE1CEE|nr:MULTISPECIES: DUF2691 family protein [unclassified Clostridium]
MKDVGVIFEIPNEYGKYLSEILEPLPVSLYDWVIDNDEIHLVDNDEFSNKFLFNENVMISGEKLYETSKTNTYYMVFVTLKGFFKDGHIKDISNYEEFLKSDCQIILGVYDCSQVMFWCKDSNLISNMYVYVQSKGYENVGYINEKEVNEGKYRIE